MGGGHAKAELQSVLEEHLGTARDKYFDLMAHPEKIDRILRAGAEKARPIARENMDRIREILGVGKSY